MAELTDKGALELATILDTMADGVFVVDTKGIVRRWNRAMERLTGYTEAEAVGQPCSLLRCDGCPENACPFGVMECHLYKSGTVDHAEARIHRKNGGIMPVMKTARVMADAQGNPIGAVETLTDISSLRRLQSEVLQLRRAVEDRFEFHDIVGRSPAMREVFSLIELAAASQVIVLIYGETGTGKELVAKAIHHLSDRKAGPFVTVNCAALSESLLESELFGHVRGAFTGAIKDHVGRFESAHQGTIFLDEIGEVSPLVQVKLLRVIQERTLERVGESTLRTVDVRIIAATHRNLLERVREGLFREDLYYRLKVFPIALPPLRDRKEDIEPLVRRFVRQFNARTGKGITGLTADAMRILMDYCWPGNVRELEHAIEHAFVTCPKGLIGPFDLPVEIRRVKLKRALCSDAAPEPAPADTPPTRRRKTVTRDRLLAMLQRYEWNKAEVARRLGVDRTSVWRKMKALGISLEPPGEE
jgi:PAS domain S-box-containing protein